MSASSPHPARILAWSALLALLATPLASGCASRGAVSAEARAAGATLEVVNRTAVDLGVSVRGRVEGFVDAGTRARFRYLTPGEAELVASPRERGRVAPRAEATTLEAGAVAVWEIVDADAPVAAPPPLADLTVDNPSRRAVTVRVDGRDLGRIFPGEARVFRDLSAGERDVVAATDVAGLAATARLTLAPGDDNAWTVALSGARLEVLNDTDEPVELRLDGVRRGTLEPGERWASDAEPPGVRVATARGLTTRRPFEANLELSTAAPTEWRLNTAGATLRVRNATGEALAVTVAGREAVALGDGAQALVEGLEAGAVRATAVGERTGMVYAYEARLGPGQRAEWTARPVRPTVRVVNESGTTQLVYVEADAIDPRPGAPKRVMRLATELAPGRAVLLEDLPESPFRLEAVDAEGLRKHAREVDPAAAPATTWVLPRSAGGVTVVNERPEDLDVYIDAVSFGLVEARATRTFTGVLVGSRLVEARGRRSRAVLRSPVEVSEEAAAVARFEDPTATLEIANALGVPLRTTGALADQRAVVPEGETVRFLVPARPHEVGLVDPDGVPLAWQADPDPGEVVRWRVAPATTSLIVTNELDEELAVTVDDASVGTVGRGETATFTGVATGRRRFATVGVSSGRVRALTEVATAARPVSWHLRSRPGRVVVKNGSAEAVEVFIDGRLHREVDPGTSLAFADILAGSRRVDAVGVRSRARQVFEAMVEEGADALVEVSAPMGTLLVDNQSGQDVIVRVDGVRMGRVSRDAGVTAVPAPAGRRLVQIEREGDHTVSGMQVAVAPAHAVHVLVPRPVARLAVANQTDGALTVRVDGRTLGEVAPGSSAVYEDLAPGRVELSAGAGEGGAAFFERRALRAGETATWVLAR